VLFFDGQVVFGSWVRAGLEACRGCKCVRVGVKRTWVGRKKGVGKVRGKGRGGGGEEVGGRGREGDGEWVGFEGGMEGGGLRWEI